MPALNKVMLIGHLGKDPELKYTEAGTAVCNFSMATTEKWKEKDGTKQEKVEWHNIVLWAKQAEVANEYLKKGDCVYIEGRLQTDKWEKDGQTHYTTKIVGERMQFLPKGDSDKKQSESKQDNDPDLPF